MGRSRTHARCLRAIPSEELERIADWCRARLTAQPDARLLVIVPGSPEAQERLLTLIRQNIDPMGAALAPLAALAGNPLAEMAGGAAHAQPACRLRLAVAGVVERRKRVRRVQRMAVLAALDAARCRSREPRSVAAGSVSAGDGRSETAHARWSGFRAPLQPIASELRSRVTDAPASSLAARRRRANGRCDSAKRSTRLNEMDSRALSSAEAQTYVRFVDLLDDFGGLESSARHDLPRHCSSTACVSPRRARRSGLRVAMPSSRFPRR